MAENTEARRQARWHDIVLEVLRLVPPVLTAIATIGIFHYLAKPVAVAIGKGADVELNVKDGSIKVAQKLFDEAAQDRSGITNEAVHGLSENLVQRIEANRSKLTGASVLWVDDNGSERNRFERKALSSLGVLVDVARTTDEGLRLLSRYSYDAVVSDLMRSGQDGAPCTAGSPAAPQAGCRLLSEMQRLCGDGMPPAIIYSANMRPELGTPAYAVGITNSPDELMAKLMDAFERRNPNDPDGGTSCVQGGPFSPPPSAEQQ